MNEERSRIGAAEEPRRKRGARHHAGGERSKASPAPLAPITPTRQPRTVGVTSQSKSRSGTSDSTRRSELAKLERRSYSPFVAKPCLQTRHWRGLGVNRLSLALLPPGVGEQAVSLALLAPGVRAAQTRYEPTV